MRNSLNFNKILPYLTVLTNFFVLFGSFGKFGSNDNEIFGEEESIKILKNLGLINNIHV